MKNLIIILISSSLFLSCKQQRTKYPHLSRIVDDTLTTTIKKYVKSTSLDTKSRFVSIEGVFEKGKTVYEISAGRSSKSYKLSQPDYFALVDDVLVIIRITDGTAIVTEAIDIGSEIDFLLNEKGIILENEMINYDPPLWTLIKCDANYRLLIERDETDLEYLPCDYYLKMDWNSGTMYLHKRDR